MSDLGVSRTEGRVAAILNAREIVINVGEAAGVKKGQKFAVLASEPLEIIDPVTNKILDTVDREKVRVQAIEVRQSVTICRTYRMRSGGGGLRIHADLLKIMPEPIPETLRIQDSSIPPPLSEEDSYVKINDRVILVADE
jgi:hypothetical protein